MVFADQTRPTYFAENLSSKECVVAESKRRGHKPYPQQSSFTRSLLLVATMASLLESASAAVSGSAHEAYLEGIGYREQEL